MSYKRGPYKKRSIEERFWEKVDVRGEDDCWLWKASLHSGGYGQIGVGWRKSPEKAHRASWTIHFGPIPGEMEILHSCDNPPCVNPKHLFCGTQLDNMQDMDAKKRRVSKGSDQTGENNHAAKLTDADIEKMWHLKSQGVKNKIIAEMFSTSRSNVSGIFHGRSWTHIKPTGELK